MNNTDISKFMDILSKMNPEELQNNIAKANEILQSSNKEEFLNKLKNM